MKRTDRMITIFSIFLVKLAVIYGILFYFDAGAESIFFLSVIGLLLLIFYLFGEIVAVELATLQDQKNQRQEQRRVSEQKRKLYEQSLEGFRKLFGGEEHEN